jgi:hypothetical protein
MAEESLQDAFAKFLASKRRQRAASGAGAAIAPQRPQETLDRLREQFVRRAIFYTTQDVPYHPRYHPEGSPHHGAPLFLDCCGLVRRICRDMRAELGFWMGGGNQSYQYDTLPERVESEAQLRPGDLIFYAGDYLPAASGKRARPWPHNMTHVEIYLGDYPYFPPGAPVPADLSERSIGARSSKGVVSVFPSFRFKPSRWTLTDLYFCRIDTWLNGVCRSVCPEHPWRRQSGWEAADGTTERVRARSIFAPPGEDGDEELDADGSDEEVSQDED